MDSDDAERVYADGAPNSSRVAPVSKDDVKNGLRRTVHRFYEELKETHAARVGLLGIPPEARSHLVCIGGASEQADLIRQILRAHNAKRVLVVGVFGGRDFWYLREHGYAVDGFDLVQPAGFPPIYVGNVEDEAALPKDKYDAIILAEVLEHLRDDARALRNLRALLRIRGVLILTVPFLDDRPEFHLRMYSPRTIRRLLTACGFDIQACYYRPGPFPLILRRPLNYLLHASNAVWYLITGRTIYHRLLPPLWSLYKFISHSERVNRLSRAFGATIVATVTEAQRDYLELNRASFWPS